MSLSIFWTPLSPQFEPGLFCDAFLGSYRNIPVRMRHSDPTLFRGVFELLVAATLIDLVPAVFLQFLDHVPAIHHPALIPRHNTHFLHTGQFVNTHSMRIIVVITPQKPPAQQPLVCASPHRATSLHPITGHIPPAQGGPLWAVCRATRFQAKAAIRQGNLN